MSMPKKRLFSFLVAITFLFSFLTGCHRGTSDVEQAYNTELLTSRLTSLWENISADQSLVFPEEEITLFLSLCDRTNQAEVLHVTEPDLKTAWESASSEAYSLVSKKSFSPIWVKADIIVKKGSFPLSAVKQDLKQSPDYFYRLGFALDSNMEIAFLEAECNANGLYDYENNEISTKAIKQYSGKRVSIPDELTMFVTQGYFCGTDNVTHKLSVDEDSFGIRNLVMSKETATGIVSISAMYLQSQMNEDGSFRYGAHVNSGKDIPGYNALRHWGAVLAMIKAYELSPNDDLAKDIDRSINYALINFVAYRDDDTAFIIEPSTDEIKIGGGALAVITLTSYAETFESDRHDDLLRCLGNGILAMGDPSTGTYQHIWTSSYEPKTDFRTVYYDGEATLALCKLYEHDPNMSYLVMAQAAADRFIAENYIQYRDHWVALAMNELTKIVPAEKYYAFALENIQYSLDVIIEQQTAYSTYTELLMAGYDTYSRIINTDAKVDYLDWFGEEKFYQAIEVRLNKGISSFGLPEVVMYFKRPMERYGCFFVRHDEFRSRIDDIQHFVCGYAEYAKSASLDNIAN